MSSSSSPLSGRRRRRRRRDEMDDTTSDAPAGFRRVVTPYPVVVDGETLTVYQVTYESLGPAEEFRRLDAIYHAELIRSWAHRNKRSRVPAAAAGEGLLREARAGNAGIITSDECAVCLQDFNKEETLRAMPCSHAFHPDCILRWLRVNPVCPLCRHALQSTQHDQDSDDYDDSSDEDHPDDSSDEDDSDDSSDDNSDEDDDSSDEDDGDYQQESSTPAPDTTEDDA